VAQDTTLSRWRHGFKSRWDYQRKGVSEVSSIPSPSPHSRGTSRSSAGRSRSETPTASRAIASSRSPHRGHEPRTCRHRYQRSSGWSYGRGARRPETGYCPDHAKRFGGRSGWAQRPTDSSSYRGDRLRSASVCCPRNRTAASAEDPLPKLTTSSRLGGSHVGSNLRALCHDDHKRVTAAMPRRRPTRGLGR
jgi:hypothetical protein